MSSLSPSRPIETIERLRWWLPVVIFLFVVIHQLFELQWVDPLASGSRFLAGVLVYGLIGPLVTWWVLTWIAANLREQEAIEQQMRQREQYLASITTASADAILSVDENGCIRSWNAGAERMFGWTADEISGENVNRLLPAELQAHGEAEMLQQAVAERGFVSHFETERVTRAGQRLVVDVTSSRLTDTAGQMIGSATIIRDITELKRAEEELRASESRLAGIIDSAMDAIITVNAKQRITVFNAAAEKMFRYPREKALGQSIDRFIPARFRDAHPQQIYAFGRTGITDRAMSSPTSLVALRADGEEFPIEATISELEAAGQKLYTVIIRDVTQRRRAEEQIRRLNRELEERVAQRTRELEEALGELRDRNDELERANQELTELDRLKSEFVSMVSHELRAPLTNINGSVELLMTDSDVEPHQVTMLQVISEQAQRLTRLVQGILNVSRIEARRLQLRHEMVDVARIIRRVAQNTHGSSPRAIDVDLRVESLMAWADRDRVEEVLTNLVDNALKYSAPTTNVLVSGYAAHGQVVVAVSDHGTGIPMDQLERIFEKFHRVEQGDNRETYGHGLGLYIARGLVEALGGRIWAESTPGEGSTFYFSLPQAPTVQAIETPAGGQGVDL